MVYKKYIIKRGKTYGPYFYESKREGNKIVTTYVGGPSEKHLNYSWIFTGVALILVTLLIFSIIYYSQATGRAALDIETSYAKGELITGTLKFNLAAGELVPKNSLVSVSYNGLEKIFVISELVDSGSNSGNFFTENSKISGVGEGYGVAGEKITYPEVEFELLVTKDTGAEKEAPAKEEKEEDKKEIPIENGNAEESGSSGSSSESEENNAIENPAAPVIPSTPENEKATPTKEDKKEEVAKETPAETNKEENKDNGKDSGKSESAGANGNAEDSGDVGDNGKSESSAVVTGAVTSENEYVVKGKTSKDKEFSYNLAEGESASIVSGSVKYNGSEIGEGNIQIKEENGKIKVTTSYSITEKGFGKEFLQEGKKGLELVISLDKFNISAVESSKIKVSLVYEGKEIVSAEKDINVEDKEKKADNETLIEKELNETIVNQTILNRTGINETNVNETILNQTESNMTILNETNVTLELNASEITNLSNVTIITSRHKIRVGERVRWSKNVSLIESREVNIELPKEAENISVRKIEKDSGEEKEAIAQVQGITGNIIFGKVSAEIALDKEKGFFGWLRGLFRGITGRAISEFNETNISVGNNSAIEIILKDNATEYVIEYTTDAPTAVESLTGNGKKVVISGPDELNYTDVLSYTNISEIYNTGQEGSIRVYWVEDGSYVGFDAYDLNGNGKLDYIEWITPHLSNQTFEIILITKAEHLNENRTFIEDVYEKVSARDGNWTEIPDKDYLRVTFERNLTRGKDITIYARAACANNSIVLVNGIEIPCEIYLKKLRLDELRGENEIY